MGGLETWFLAKLLGLLTSNIVGNRISEVASAIASAGILSS
ncbi:hypothetical protein [Microcoleus asticus]|nr:hypothetical protein [Microcoleus asticus]